MNENDRKFSIAKAPPDPETLAIFDARRKAYEEPRHRMDRAKYMFGELCDRATNTHGPGFQRKGSVVVPDSELARKFGVWESTIYTWKKQLEACGYIWTSKQYRSDRWPITVYHLACIHPRPSTSSQNADGTSNNGTRSTPGRVGEPTPRGKTWSAGARKPGQRSLPLAQPLVTPIPWNTPPAKPRKLKSLAIVAAIRSFDGFSATAQTGCEPRRAPAVSHGPDRLTATAGTGSQPRPNGADSHNAHERTATNGQGHKRVSVSSVSHSESVGEANPPVFAKWQSGLNKLYPRELEAMRAELRSKVKAAATDKARAEWRKRLDAVEAQLYGGTVTDTPRVAKARMITLTEPPAETLSPSEQEFADTVSRRLAKVRR